MLLEQRGKEGRGHREAAASWRAFHHAAQELDFILYARGSERRVSSRRLTWSDLCLRKVNLAAVSKMDWRVKKPGGGETQRRPSKISELLSGRAWM